MAGKQFDDATPEIIDGLILYEESNIARDVIELLVYGTRYNRTGKFSMKNILEFLNLERGLPINHAHDETKVYYDDFIEPLKKLEELGIIEKDEGRDYSITKDGYEVYRISGLVKRWTTEYFGADNFDEKKRKEFENDYKTYVIEALKKAKEGLT